MGLVFSLMDEKRALEGLTRLRAARCRRRDDLEATARPAPRDSAPRDSDGAEDEDLTMVTPGAESAGHPPRTTSSDDGSTSSGLATLDAEIATVDERRRNVEATLAARGAERPPTGCVSRKKGRPPSGR